MELKRENTTLNYEVSGDPNGQLIVFANSLGTNLDVWEEILPYLSGYQFLRYDKRGHGKSTLEGEFDMGHLVDDAIALVEEVGARDVIFIGLSIGGMIGQGICTKRPDLIKGFVLMDSAAKIGTEEFWAERIKSIQADGIASMSEPLMERWFTKEFIEAGKAEPWRKIVEATSIEGYVGCCQAIAQTDFTASTATIKIPTLALVGSQDGSTPPDLVLETAKLIEGAQFEIIKNAGHIPCVERPKETAELVLKFMESLS